MGIERRRVVPLVIGLAAVFLVFSAGFGRKFFRRACSSGRKSLSTKREKLSKTDTKSNGLTMSILEVENMIRQLADTTVEDENEVTFCGKGLKLDTEKDAQVVVDEIRNCLNMTTLCMEGNTIGVEAAKAIAKVLESQPYFRRALWRDMFTGRLKTEIPDALNYLSAGIMLAEAQLTELDLSDNAFGPVGVKGIVTLLKSKSCQTLQILRLNNNGLGITGGKLLAQALQHNADRNGDLNVQHKFALKTFICGRNRLENEGAKAIAAVLKTLGSLEEVAMPQNGIYHPGISAIAEALSHNPQLKVINFNDNTFTELGAKAFAKNMVHFQNLEIINFGDCLLKTEGAIAIANAIKEQHDKLKEVHLGFNEIGQLGGIAIAEAMENKMRLQRLEINGNGFGNEGCEIIEGTMDAFGLSSQLGSLSEDEGAGEEEEENDSEDDDQEHHEEEEVYDEDDEHGESLSSNQSIIIEEEQKELSISNSNNKLTVEEFVVYPTGGKLLQLGNERADLLVNYLGNKANFETLLEYFVNISSIIEPSSDEQLQKAVFECCDKLLSTAFQLANDSEQSISELSNVILVHIGLIKSEDKKFRCPKDLRGCFMALEFCSKQKYFSKLTKNSLQLFLGHPNKIVEACGKTKHNLMRTLYQS